MATRKRLPTVGFINSIDAALLAGVDERTFHKYRKSDDPPPREEDGTYELEKFGKWLREREAKKYQVEYDTEGVQVYNPIQERARKDKEFADKAALENRVRRGELVESAEVEARWTEMVLSAKSKLLRIPFAAAPLLLGVEDQNEAMQIIDDQIRDALMELTVE